MGKGPKEDFRGKELLDLGLLTFSLFFFFLVSERSPAPNRRYEAHDRALLVPGGGWHT